MDGRVEIPFFAAEGNSAGGETHRSSAATKPKPNKIKRRVGGRRN